MFKKIFSISGIIFILCLLIYSTICTRKLNKYRGHLDTAREQLIRAEEYNRELTERIGSISINVHKLGELADRNVNGVRQCIEIIEETRAIVHELEDCCLTRIRVDSIDGRGHLGRHVIRVVARRDDPAPRRKRRGVCELRCDGYAIGFREIKFIVAALAAFCRLHDFLNDHDAVLVDEVLAVRAFFFRQDGMHDERVVARVDPEIARAVVAIAHAADGFLRGGLCLLFGERASLLLLVVRFADRDGRLDFGFDFRTVAVVHRLIVILIRHRRHAVQAVLRCKREHDGGTEHERDDDDEELSQKPSCVFLDR